MRHDSHPWSRPWPRLWPLLSGSLVLGCILLLSVVATATPEEDAALAQIKEAVDTHYLATDFVQAQSVLLGAIEACKDQCTPQTLAKAWMYVGLVRGVGLNDEQGARVAFANARKLDPAVELDAKLSTPEANIMFEEATSEAVASDAPTGVDQAATPVVLGGMKCTPTLSEVQTRRPIPIACTTDQPATKAELKYREFGSNSWETIQMGSAGGQWLGTVPCSATDLQGKLSWYVNARDQNGEVIDNFGAQRQPVEVTLVETTSEAPPAFPGQNPPARCGSASECPEEMLGTPACPGTIKPDPNRGHKGAGEICEKTPECSSGLDCVDGQCQAPKSCERDADCTEGRCVDLLCKSDTGSSSPKGALNWLGLHFAADVAMVSGSEVCTDSDFGCFNKDGTPLSGGTFTDASANSGKIQPGFALGTLRVLASYERLVTDNIGVEGRLGFAFNGAPSGGGVSFLPLHLEARAKYWLLGAPASTLFAPYVAAGAGLAQIDTKVNVVVRQCPASAPSCQVTEVEAYRQMGVVFVTVSGGALFALGPNYGINLNLNALVLLPKTGFALQPSLGFAYGF